MSALTALVSLVVRRAEIIPSGYRTLTKLGNLRHISFNSCRHLPACLSQLTALEHITIYNPILEVSPEEAEVDSLRAALPRLTNLTSLFFSPLPGMDSPPAELAGLSLASFAWWGDCPEGYRVPIGAWLANLRGLRLPARVLAISMQQLKAAQQLAWLTVSHADACPDGTIAIIRWAVHFPSLQRLTINGTSLPCSVCDALLDAQRHRPGLLFKVKQ